MGERCFVGFVDSHGTEQDLSVYLHWDGYIDDLYAITQMCRLLGYRSAGDVDYMVARFIFMAGCKTGADNGCSVGVFADTEHDYGADWGRYVIGESWRIVRWTDCDGCDDTQVSWLTRRDGECVPTGDDWKHELRVLNSRLPEDAALPDDIIDDFLGTGYTPEIERRVREYRSRQFRERYDL